MEEAATMDVSASAPAGCASRRIAVGDGLFLEAHDYAPEPPETGLPVICLHGLTRNARDFEIVAPRIAALGRRVVALSMRGRGGSDRDSDPARYAPPIYVQDVIKALDALEIERAVFIGTSMGGIITMALAAVAGGRVGAAALNDIGPVIEAAGLARIGTYVGRGEPVSDWAEAANAVKAVNGAAFPREADNAEFWLRFAKRTYRAGADGRPAPDCDPAIAQGFGQTQSGPPADLTPLFQALAQRPVLIVRGALSDILSADGLARMRALKPDLVSMEVPDIGHAPTLEEPEAWDALLDFLARTP
ncbi:MAG: alpha/beta fold hydrolase [Hyphomonadaceae bacterium]